MTDPTKKAESKVAPKQDEAGFDPLSSFPAGWYRLHLKKTASGARSRIAMVGNGMMRFKATQTDEKADNFPTKLVHLTSAQVRDYTRSPDWQITKSNGPEPKGLDKGVVKRTIGASKQTNEAPKSEETV